MQQMALAHVVSHLFEPAYLSATDCFEVFPIVFSSWLMQPALHALSPDPVNYFGPTPLNLLCVVFCKHWCTSYSLDAGATSSSVAEVHAILERIWATAAQPLVMGLAGASVRFSTLPSGLALKALATAAIGQQPNTPRLHLPAATWHVMAVHITPGFGLPLELWKGVF